MIGRRLPDDFSARPNFSWDDTKAGDYWKLGDQWFLVSPEGEFGGTDTRWTVVEHEDGTITISPSVFFNSPRGWHGFLQRGIWRRV